MKGYQTMSKEQMELIEQSSFYEVEVSDYVDSESDVDALVDEFDLDLETRFL